jgi:hypothetical protein
VIAQTSNEHLDELNARAQAIRRQHGQLGEDGSDVPGRPYQLHPGDLIQVRHTIRHPDHGQLPNGTTAVIADVDPDAGLLDLRLGDGTELRLDEQQLADADLRSSTKTRSSSSAGRPTATPTTTRQTSSTQAACCSGSPAPPRYQASPEP